MKALSLFLLVLAVSVFFGASPVDRKKHPALPRVSGRAPQDALTSSVTAGLLKRDQAPGGSIARVNYIDDFIFSKMERNRIPHAPLSSDEEFLRRVFLDLTGRLPEPDRVRGFLKNSDPDKRSKLVDELTDAKVDGITRIPGATPGGAFPFPE